MEKKENCDALGFSNEFINFETVVYSMIIVLKVKVICLFVDDILFLFLEIILGI